MKKCLVCGKIYSTSQLDCSDCHAVPEIQDGFTAYAPALSAEGRGFNVAFFADLAQLEHGHFWFRARNRLIIWTLGKYCPEFRSFLEIGCGTGYVLSGIADAFPDAEIHGSEIFTAGLSFAATRISQSNLMQMDARQIPFMEEFDAIGAFDVLEHIEQDEMVLKQIYDALKPDGVVLLTVPQHAWLWTFADDVACHVRRYSADELHKKITNTGFKILRSTSFVSLLLPAMLLSRFVRKAFPKDFDATAEFRLSPWLNGLFEVILDAERVLIRKGLNFPLGGSRLVAARK